MTSSIVDQVNEAAVEWARERAASMVGMKYLADGSLAVNPAAEWAITESTRELLRADVAAAITEGMSTDELAEYLAKSYAFSDDRAEMIARTEIANADIQGSLIGWRESGVVEGKEVLLSSEHEGPDECDDAADMGVVPIDDDFGGLGDPPFHPRCECDISPVLMAEGEEA
jgi:Phage Mu protein F like protein